MRTHPRDKTLYQLKQSIATDKKRLEEYEREWRNSNMKDKKARARMNNAMSLIRTAEFQLQRKSDALGTPQVKRAIKELRKNLIGYFTTVMSAKWNEDNWNNLEKECRNFIQNYNEL